MARYFLIIALFALFSVSFAAQFFSLPHHPNSVDLSQCVNQCSGHGMCIKSNTTASTSCLCQYPAIGVDCAYKASMLPIQWLGNTTASYWFMNSTHIIQRVGAIIPATGWVGVMYGSTDGMAGGQSTVLTITNDVETNATEMYSAKKAKPSVMPDQSIPAVNTAGAAYLTESGDSVMDVTFVRALDTGLDKHAVIPAKPGTATTLSIAYASIYFSFHAHNATFGKFDLAAVAGVGKVQVALA